MADITEKIILDDSNFIKGLDNISNKISDVSSKVNKLQTDTNNASKEFGDSLAKGSQQAAKELDNLTRAASDNSKAELERKKAIFEVARSIAENKKAVDGLGKGYAILQSRSDESINKILTGSKEFRKALSEVSKQAGLTGEQTNILFHNFEEVANQAKQISSEEFKELGDEAEKTTTKFLSAKRELRELTNQLTSGELEGEAFDKAQARAAELTDSIGDMRAEISALSSDTFNLDAVIQGFQAITVGAGLAQGTMALLGDENEDFQESLTKLNAIMVISQSLQQAHALLYQETALAIKLARIQQRFWNIVVGESTGILKKFRVALALTGIGAIILGIGALITNWDKLTDSIKNSNGWLGKVADSFKKVDSVIKGVWESIKFLFETYGNAVVNLFSGNISQILEDAKNFAKDLKEVYKDAVNENETQKMFNHIAKEYDKLAAQQKRNAELLAAQGKDNFKELEKQIQNELSALRLRNAETEEIDEKRHELQLLRLKRDADALKRVQEMRKQFQTAVKDLQDLDHDLSILDEREYFAIIQSRTVAMYKAQRDELIKLGKDLNTDVSDFVKRFDYIIKTTLERGFVGEIEGIETPYEIWSKRLEKDHWELSKKVREQNKQRAIDIGKGMKLSFKDAEIEKEPFLEVLDDFLDSIQVDIEKHGSLLNTLFFRAFGEGEGSKEALKGIHAFVSEFGAIINEATDIQLNAIDKQLNELTKRRSDLEDGLKREQELYELGLANNLEAKQQEVDGLLSEEARLTSEREKIQREAERRQLIAETAQQTQSLITSGIDIIKGFSKIPIVGLPLGIAAVATLFGFFAKMKADAFKATRLHTGADRIDDYFGTVGHKSDIPGRGNGYRVVDTDTGRDTGVVISGREQLIPEKLTKQQAKLFKRMKEGRYNFDIAEALELSGKSGGSVMSVVNNQTIANDMQWVSYTDRKGDVKLRLMKIPKSGEGSIVTIKQ